MTARPRPLCGGVVGRAAPTQPTHETSPGTWHDCAGAPAARPRGDGELTRGLVVVDRLVSSRTPAIEEPAPFAVVEGPHPRLRVEDFRSPEHEGFEARSLGLWLVKEEGGELRQVWSSFASPPGATEALLGDGPLAPGRYWIAVTFGERRRAGPLRLVRGSRTLRPFEVR